MNPLDELTKITNLFPGAYVQKAEHVPAAPLPEAYRKMLAHEHHMTVTMEDYYQTSVDVKVLDEKLEGDIYSRKIALLKQGTDTVVQFGIVRFNFEYVTSFVREEILAGQTPLGRVLINHNVLRHIDLGALIRFQADSELAELFKIPVGTTTYGRLATIFCNELPAVDLLEVPAPLDDDAS